MMGLAPFMRGHQMLRTWAALMGASVATYFAHDPVSFMAIDAIAAAAIMARPSGLPQRAIGALFTLMVLFDLGFYLSPQNGWGLYYGALTAVGWVQWAILGAWAGHDWFGRYRSWSGPPDRLPAAYQRRMR